VLDTGAMISIISERVCNKFIEAGIVTLQFPVSNVVLRSAFGTRSERVKKQASIEYKIGGVTFEFVFLICNR
jgi:hypothetical protein